MSNEVAALVSTRAPTTWPLGVAAFKLFVFSQGGLNLLDLVNHQYRVTKDWQSLTKDFTVQRLSAAR